MFPIRLLYFLHHLDVISEFFGEDKIFYHYQYNTKYCYKNGTYYDNNCTTYAYTSIYSFLHDIAVL